MNKALAFRNLGLSRFLESGIKYRGPIGRKQKHCCARQFSTTDNVLDHEGGGREGAESQPEDVVNLHGWDYDILINGGGIVGITFAAQILQKTSNKLKIGRSNFEQTCEPLISTS
jgi:hypothetical protein